MNGETQRPDPDQILRAIRQNSDRRGHLRVFIGMAAGVGKTYAMLKAAHRLQQQGANVLVGVVESHGRHETQVLLEGLKVISKVTFDYRGKQLAEMDLDGILAAHPEVVLVDELAHSNVPGSRHEKRYQDVEEILNAGIAVFTTVNVQHLESRKAVVEEITGIRVHETVPDIFLDLAKEITLIDLEPDELLRRLDAGKVYDEVKKETAKKNFFTKVNLKALRELTLRFTAGHVERDLLDERSLLGMQKTLKTAPRLEVAVFASPYSESLLRWTKLLADSMGGTWVAAYVDDGKLLSEEEKVLLSKNFALVNSLGGELVTTIDVDPVAGIIRVAKQNNINMIVVGKSRRSLFSHLLGKPNITARLLEESGDIDVFVFSTSARLSRKTPKTITIEDRIKEPFPLKQLGFITLIVFITWFSSAFLLDFVGYRTVGFLFLLSVFFGSLILNRVSIAIVAIVSGIIWNIFFIPPLYTMSVSEPEDMMMLAAFFIAAFVMGSFTHRLKIQEHRVRQREERAQTLYRVTRRLGLARTRSEVFAAVADALSSALSVPASVFIPSLETPTLLFQSAGNFIASEKEKAVAAWVFTNGKSAGRGTETLSQANGYYFPLVVSQKTEAVLGVQLLEMQISRQEIEGLLETIGQLAAVALEREAFRERTVDLEVLQRTQILYHALFDSVSHELKTPLSAIHGSVSALLDELQNDRMKEFAKIISESSDRLLQTVDNMLNMSRIESGLLKPNLETHDLCDVVNGALRDLKLELDGHTVILNIDATISPILCDIGLIQIALRNILRNASRYTPRGSTIKIVATETKDAVILEVKDNGPGLPVENPEKVFEKFYRVAPERTGGLGLGLSIAQRFIAVQNGSLEARNQDGAVFRIQLPKGIL